MQQIKADLHMHGPIGFQDYWLEKQGYSGKNLLKEIADSCFARDLGISAITSEEDEIPPNTLHDRLNWLKNEYASSLPEEYETDTLGDNILIVGKGDKKVYLVNGQTVRTGKVGDPLFKGSTIDYLVIGTNQITNHESIDDTVKRVYETSDIFGGAEHALCEAHGGMGRDKIRELANYISFIEGHNSQLIWPFGNYSKGLNEKAQEFSEFSGMPWIATSDAHRIQDAGLSSIDFDSKYLDTSSGSGFLQSLKNIIRTNSFDPSCDYESYWGWCDWVSKLAIGLTIDKKKIKG